MKASLSRELIALRAARELSEGMYINLGIGLPTLVSQFIPEGMEVMIHAENGVLGYGRITIENKEMDIDLVNAGLQPVTLYPGASFFNHADGLHPPGWLIQLRKEGIIEPTKPGGRWLYTEEQVRQIPSLVDEMRKCERCGEPRPPGYHRFCRECSQYKRKHYYRSLSPEEKAEHRKRCVAWRKANTEKWKEISFRAHRKSRARCKWRNG